MYLCGPPRLSQRSSQCCLLKYFECWSGWRWPFFVHVVPCGSLEQFKESCRREKEKRRRRRRRRRWSLNWYAKQNCVGLSKEWKLVLEGVAHQYSSIFCAGRWPKARLAQKRIPLKRAYLFPILECAYVSSLRFERNCTVRCGLQGLIWQFSVKFTVVSKTSW